MRALPVTKQDSYNTNFDMLFAPALWSAMICIPFNFGRSAVPLIMPAVACFGPAGIEMMRLRRSAGAGLPMSVTMSVAFMAGMGATVMVWRPSV